MIQSPANRGGPGQGPALVNLLLISGLVVCLAIVGFYLFGGSKPPPQQLPPPPKPSAAETLDVLVPIEKIDVGVQLDAGMFRKETRAIVGGSANVVTNFEQLKGGYAASFIAAGEPVLIDYITTNPPLNQIQAKIPDGFRAVTLAVDATSAVEGWVRAGAKVDVLMTPSRSDRPTLTMIVQNAKVLSAARSTSGDPGAAPMAPGSSTTVTLLVTGDDAARLQLAVKSGALSLALRGDEDTVESAQNATIGIESILGISPKATPNAVASEGRVKVGGKEFLVVDGKLVSEQEAAEMKKSGK